MLKIKNLSTENLISNKYLYKHGIIRNSQMKKRKWENLASTGFLWKTVSEKFSKQKWNNKEGNLEHKEKKIKPWNGHKYRLSSSSWVFKIMFDVWNKNYYSWCGSQISMRIVSYCAACSLKEKYFTFLHQGQCKSLGKELV